MNKTELIKKAEESAKRASENGVLGYKKERYGEIAKASVSVIKAVCKIEKLTVNDARLALKMAEEIIEEEIRKSEFSE